MQNSKRLLIASIALLLTGCFGDKGESTSRATAPATTSRVSDDNAFSSQVRALEKAEQVNQLVMDHKQAIDARLQ